MSPPHTIILSLFIIFISFDLSFGFYIEDKHYQTNYQHYTTTAPTRLMRMTHMSQQMVNVDNYGAIANDGRDDTEAFEKAWNEACSIGAILVVPEKRVYHLKPITFSGPCQPNTAFKVYGTIKAWPHMSAYEKDRRIWIMFDSIMNLVVDGGGIINGNGRKWWQNSCKVNKSLAVTFYQCNNLQVKNLKFKNAQQMHVRFQKCFNVRASNLLVKAPGNSPNTDGIHITGTQNMIISNSIIGTGDDCISIVSGSKNIRAIGITCGPGHGISIGSLGADNSKAEVSNVIVNRATLTGTTNGVRIKTWQGGYGYATNIKFMNMAMRNVTNPIIIDQNYCDQKEPCQEKESAVALSNVVYQNIRGTSASEVAIKFECSKTVPCRGIYMQNVILTPEDGDGISATCENVRFSNRGKFSPHCSSA
ncbi:putative polygalacturonase [Lupinus albus]|uniref:endo-polygalacturonase n=1 Tax=Lupinus albus TaxID=3870 RepID=A0A6A4NV01_LUPAL|nr:putative polygalacturonase [Lupinus albus]